jgi:hypothetical protein
MKQVLILAAFFLVGAIGLSLFLGWLADQEKQSHAAKTAAEISISK